MPGIKHPFIVVLLSLLILFLFSGCSLSNPIMLSSPTLPDTNSQPAPNLVFSGKVTDPNSGEWKNDYMVFIFLDGEEIARQVSHLGKLAQSGDGVHDGLFKIVVPNTYELTPVHTFVDQNHKEIGFENVPSSFGRMDYMYTWFGELSPGGVIRIDVPEKQIEYAIKIMPTSIADETADLPSHGHAILTDAGIVIPRPNSAETAVPTPTSLPNDPQIAAEGNQPDVNKPAPSLNWSRAITNFHGNRWEVWEHFQLNQIPGLTFAQFKDEVLIHNPRLITDNFVFYPTNHYVIPEIE